MNTGISEGNITYIYEGPTRTHTRTQSSLQFVTYLPSHILELTGLTIYLSALSKNQEATNRYCSHGIISNFQRSGYNKITTISK